jgi:hypothetical protein
VAVRTLAPAVARTPVLVAVRTLGRVGLATLVLVAALTINGTDPLPTVSNDARAASRGAKAGAGVEAEMTYVIGWVIGGFLAS